MIILPPNIRYFSSFLAVSMTDKQVNRNIRALSLKQLNVFALREFIFHDIHKKQGMSSSNSDYKIQKICGWKIYSRTRTFGRNYTNRIFESKNGTTSMEMVNQTERQFFFSMICLPIPIVLKYRLFSGTFTLSFSSRGRVGDAVNRSFGRSVLSKHTFTGVNFFPTDLIFFLFCFFPLFKTLLVFKTF